MPILAKSNRLKKELGLFDVYAISTGAMFSSGFFLLPGLAAAKAGPSVVLAYLFAGILILPAMFSKAELSTALPRAGGTYYFLDRALGPMFGTIGGLGTYLALVLKTAFALVGVGAYAAIFVELPIKPVAVALTVAFVTINVVGAKETSGLQRLLVVVLLTTLAFFIAEGFQEVIFEQPRDEIRQRFTPFFEFGFAGLLSTIGFVFVSYAGLTKVASVAEEVRDPDRNIPLGMTLSLASTTVAYVFGTMIMVAVLDPDEFHRDLAPVASAAATFTGLIPSPVWLVLIVVAALAAFASTGNAGILAASRYPMAMARDRLLPGRFAQLGRFRTPTAAIVVTGALMIVFILILDEEGIAKLASSFQLFIFMLVNLAVIVMRESRIPSYDPGYRSPFYPWTQIVGIVVYAVLIAYMGWLAVAFTAAVTVLCLIWYFRYAQSRVVRDGAIYHWFQRLGRKQYGGLDPEFRSILKEKGLRADDPFDEVVARSHVIDVQGDVNIEDLLREASDLLSTRLSVVSAVLERGFRDGTRTGATPVSGGAALPHLRLQGIDQPELVLVRTRTALFIDQIDSLGEEGATTLSVNALFFLVSPEGDPGQHLRMLAQIASRVDGDGFVQRWLDAADGAELRAQLLSDAYLTLHLRAMDGTGDLIGRTLRDLELPEGCLVAVIHRGDSMIVPRGNVVLEEHDLLTILGEGSTLAELRARYRV